MIRGEKIVSVEEMRRIEERAFELGYLAIDFMNAAGKKIAQEIERFIQKQHLPKHISLVVGKGNNGGDAYTAGSLLLLKGFSVRALTPFSLNESSSLCREKAKHFMESGGTITALGEAQPQGEALLVDGLVGTGFQGKAEGALAEGIVWCNRSSLPIFSIDIPSGVDGTTGEVRSVAIHASHTLYLGLPKMGFFLQQGWDHVGQLVRIDLGLTEELMKEARGIALLVDPVFLTLPLMQRSRHKYQAGYVLGIGGSLSMPGAGELSAKAALCSGAGIIRLYGEASKLTPEIIYDKRILMSIQQEMKRGSSCFVGPGLGRDRETESFLEKFFPSLSLPSVIDADALYWFSKNRSWVFPQRAIVTPHRGEMQRLMKEEFSLQACQEYAQHHGIVLVVKGAPTMIFSSGLLPLIVAQGDPGMATAGSGDLLTGILAGLLAQQLAPYEAAVLGVYLHSRAGELAAAALTSYCMIASDILDALPGAFRSIVPFEQR